MKDAILSVHRFHWSFNGLDLFLGGVKLYRLHQFLWITFDFIECLNKNTNYVMQEFMILPVGASSFREAMQMGSEVYHHLKVKSLLLNNIYSNVSSSK